MFVGVGHQKLTEMPDDRTADAFVGNPFYNGLGFDVAQLL
jgi:hypothetical protein